MRGQATLVRELTGGVLGDAIDRLDDTMEPADSLDQLPILEAAAASAYWQAWAEAGVSVRLTRRDNARVPEHWRRFESLRSGLRSVNGNKHAERPVNALLNYLLELAESEAIAACHMVGLDPGLGIIHTDARGRASMALDHLKPVRPAVERYVLDLVTRRTFRKLDFAERSDGHVRILPPLTHELAERLPAGPRRSHPGRS